MIEKHTMIYYCLNCSITIEGQKRKYCSNECSNEYSLKKKKHKRQSIRPKKSYTKKEVGKLLKCRRETITKVINFYNIKLEKTITGKREYITEENFLLIKQIIEEKSSLSKKGFSTTQLAKEVGTSFHLVKKILKKYNIKETDSDEKSFYYDESTIKLVKQLIEEDYNEKENYLDKMQIAFLFGYNPKDIMAANPCFARIKEKYGKPPCEPKWIKSGIDKFASRICYPKDSILKWIEQIKSTNAWSCPRRQCKLTEEEKLKKQQEKLKKERELLEQTKDLIISKEAVSLLEYKRATPFLLNKLYKLPSTKKVKGKFYFKPSEVLELKEYLEKEKLEQQEKSKKRLERERPRLAKDWTTDEAYEHRLWKKIQSLGMPKNLNEKQQQRWLNNKRLMKNGQLGIIKTFKCNICDKELPYTSFYCEFNRGNKDGREYRCKNCQNSNKKRINAKKPKTATTFATQFTTSIKQELSRQNGYYIEISVKEIWENMPYTKEEFIANIESKFAPWMTWELNGRPSKSQKKAWQLDHVKPRASFLYKNMQDPQFIECWSLDNLQPLEARMNILKSNKDLMQKCCWQFRKGLIDINYNKGIWQHLPYTPVQAREELEKKHGQEIDWNKFKGSKLHVDHVIPQAKLGFNSFQDKNFCECWKLDNLQILLHNNNSSKGSRYKGKIWFHNKT